MRVCADIDIAATGNGGQRQDEGFFVKRHRRAEGDAERALLAYALVLERLYDGLRTEPPGPQAWSEALDLFGSPILIPLRHDPRYASWSQRLIDLEAIRLVLRDQTP